MSQAVNGICQGIRTLIGASRVTEAVERVSAARNESESFIYSWELIAEAVAFFANSTALVVKGVDSGQSLVAMKAVEMFALTMKVTPTMTRVIGEWVNGNKDTLRAIEEGLIAPTAGIVRVATECQIYQYRYLATLPDSERFISELDGCGSVIKTPISVEECKARESRAEKVLPIANIADISATSGLISKTLMGGAKLYQALADYAARQAPSPAAGSIDVNSVIISVPALQWREIPECLHNDPIFSRFTCAISLAPIRDPVLDANGRTLYERSVILAALQANPRSPMTRQPMTPQNLIEATHLKMLIDQRLDHYQQLMANAIQRGSAAPSDPQLLQTVNAAHSSY